MQKSVTQFIRFLEVNRLDSYEPHSHLHHYWQHIKTDTYVRMVVMFCSRICDNHCKH